MPRNDQKEDHSREVAWFFERQWTFIIHANPDIKTYANINNNIMRKHTFIVLYY